MKVTSFSWHEGGCRYQKETGDSFGSRGEGVSGWRCCPGGGGEGKGAAPAPIHSPHHASSPGLRGGRGRARKKRQHFCRPQKQHQPTLLNIVPNWHICPWGWGWGRHLSKEMGVVSELNPLPASFQSWSFTKNCDVAGCASPCECYTALRVCTHQRERVFREGDQFQWYVS